MTHYFTFFSRFYATLSKFVCDIFTPLFVCFYPPVFFFIFFFLSKVFHSALVMVGTSMLAAVSSYTKSKIYFGEKFSTKSLQEW